MACLALTVALGAAIASAAADTVIDDFDNRSTIAPWTFYNGAEFPGATGSLALGSGHTGQGAHLAYNFTAGGAYVEAALTLPAPLNAAAISFWVRSPADIYVSLRVVDTTGQTLQYQLNRPITAGDTTAWYLQVVALDAPTLWYDGAGDGVVHGPITALGILAGNAQISRPADAIDFDQVTAVSSTTITLGTAATLLPAPAGNTNLLAGMGVNIHFTSDDQALDAAAAAGFSWARMDLFWEFTEESAGVYNFAAYDTLVSSLASRGMHALLILDYGNPLYTGTGQDPPTTAAAIAAYANFAKAAAAHFAGTGTRFEVWNEPDVTSFWLPATNPAQFATLAKAAVAAIHQGDPDALVTTAGLAGFDYSFASGYLSQGGGVGANAIGVHPYDVTNPVGNLVDNLVLLRSLAAQNLGSAPPIWDTEWGFSAVSFSPPGATNGHDPGAQKQQAQFVVEEMLAACGAGFPLYIYYDIQDDGTDATNLEDNFGLLATDYTAKPAYTAMATLAKKVRGRTFAGFLSGPPTSIVAMQFDGPTSQMVVMWSDAPTASVSVKVPANAYVSDFLGNALTVPNGTLNLTGGTGPIYVTTVSQGRLSNLSVRSDSTPGVNELIAGFAVAGGSKRVLVRGDGPSLASFGVSGFLPSVTLTLFDASSDQLATDTGWGGTAQLVAAFSQVGAFPLPDSSLDSALLKTLPAGSYTASVVGSGGSAGVGLAEVYDADTGTPASRLTNGSARTFVGTGAQVLIAGFTVTGPGEEQLVIRAIGPSLTTFGVTGVLARPTLTVFDASQNAIYSNTVWGGTADLTAAFTAVGAFALDATSLDSALLVSLAPGAYTAEVTGVDGGTGVALVEIYELPPAL